MKKALTILLVVVLLIAFGVSGYMVVNYLVQSKKQAEQYNELAQIAAQAQTTTAETTEETTEAPTETTEETEPTEPPILPGYDELYELNNDMVGWIRIDGTVLNYPVMQTPEDPNYYLYRDFYGNDSTQGSIYAWSTADINEPSDNITLFGHHMANGSMFQCLTKYQDEEEWENNSLIFFDTLTEYHTYKIFAVFKTTANKNEGFKYHQFVDAQTEEEFDQFIATCKDLAFYDTGITPVYGDKVICLSTCEYTQTNGRLVVAAVRIS